MRQNQPQTNAPFSDFLVFGPGVLFTVFAVLAKILLLIGHLMGELFPDAFEFAFNQRWRQFKFVRRVQRIHDAAL